MGGRKNKYGYSEYRGRGGGRARMVLLFIIALLAVLLAARQEGKEGTALVVAPASLVYNWGEEIRAFAPQLSHCFITGGQEERREKLSHYREYDVVVTSYDLLKRDIENY